MTISVGHQGARGNCSAYDRIYEVTRFDLERLDETGEATVDIVEWPWEVGAPVRDGDGIPDNYDLAGGDRPELTGHQMRDLPNMHDPARIGEARRR